MRPIDIQARVLTDALRPWMEPCPFERGDLVVVRQKGDGMGPGSWNPNTGSVFMVASRLSAASPFCIDHDGALMRLYDMIVIAMDPDGEIEMLLAESRHFTKYTGEIA